MPNVEYKSALYDIPYGPLGGLKDRAEALGDWLNDWARQGWRAISFTRLGGLDREESRLLVVFERGG